MIYIQRNKMASNKLLTAAVLLLLLSVRWLCLGSEADNQSGMLHLLAA